MRKRKNDDRPGASLGMIGLGAGVVLLLLLSAGTIVLWLNDKPTPTYTYVYPTQAVYRAVDNSVRPTVIPNVLPSMRPDEARLILSTLSGDILASGGTAGLHSTGLQGRDVTVAPDNRTWAYLRDGGLYIYRGGKEQSITTPGKV